MKTLICLFVVWTITLTGMLNGYKLHNSFTESAQYANAVLANLTKETNVLSQNVNHSYATTSAMSDAEVIQQEIATHPSDAPFWLALLSTLSTAIVAAIIRILEKRSDDGTLFAFLFRKKREKYRREKQLKDSMDSLDETY